MVELMQRTMTRVMSPLYERMFLVLTIVFCSSLAIMVFQVSRLQEHLIEAMVLVSGDLYANVMHQLQTLYAHEVVQRVRASDLQDIANAALFLVVVWIVGIGLVISKLRRNSNGLAEKLVTQSKELNEARWQIDIERANRHQVEESLCQAQVSIEQRVAGRISQLQQVNTALSKEIAERRQAEAGIRELNVEMHERTVRLEASNKELEVFSYTVSHDLRAPLRSIEGFSQALLDDCGSQLDVTAQKYVMRVKEATQRMDQVIEALLQLARISTANLNLRPIDITGIGRSAMEECQGTDPSRKVDWILMENLATTADSALVRVVVDNLIGNAWKFTKQLPHARIELGVTYQYAQPVFYVRDNGAGFDMAYVNNLFKVFQRLHAESEFPGVGIGLATVHRIVTRHGGTIWADSVLGNGATFFFTLEPQVGGL